MVAKKRPLVVSIICWFLISTSILSILWFLLILNNPSTLQVCINWGVTPIKMFLSYLWFVIITVIACIAMLKRQRWGLHLYFIGILLSIMQALALYGIKKLPMVVPSLVLNAVIFIMLTGQSATNYFSTSVQGEDTAVNSGEQGGRGISGGRQALSIILLVLGGLAINISLMFIPLWRSPKELVILSGIFVCLACIFVVPAVFIWGRKRWSLVLGTFFTVAGGFLLYIVLVLMQSIFWPVSSHQMAIRDDMTTEQILFSAFVSGIAEVGLGLLLTSHQRRKDKKAENTAVPV